MSKPKLSHHMPPYPRTPHLPYQPNKTDDDLLASHADVAPLFLAKDVSIFEKVDGSNIGVCLWEDYPVIRNKRNFFNKGHLGKTPGKNQFRSIFNFFHDHQENFELLNSQFIKPPVVYGEWMIMAHGIRYDALPSLFIAFAVWTGDRFVPIEESRRLLTDCGFTMPLLLHHGPVADYAQLEELCQGESEWVTTGDRRREGIYIHVGQDRFKMVRSDFVRGKYFDPENRTMVKNKVRRNGDVKRNLLNNKNT